MHSSAYYTVLVSTHSLFLFLFFQFSPILPGAVCEWLGGSWLLARVNLPWSLPNVWQKGSKTMTDPCARWNLELLELFNC